MKQLLNKILALKLSSYVFSVRFLVVGKTGGAGLFSFV
jgi:hypothetical protein